MDMLQWELSECRVINVFICLHMYDSTALTLLSSFSGFLASSRLKRQDSLRRACCQNSVEERRVRSEAWVTYGSSCGVSKRSAKYCASGVSAISSSAFACAHAASRAWLSSAPNNLAL